MKPENFRPPERIAIKGIRFGERFVEFGQRHGTRIEKVLRKEYGSDVNGILKALADEMLWIESGRLP